MFRKSSSDSLTLTIVDESYIFTSAKEFDFALSGRTCLPSAKMTSLVKLSDDELRREAEAIRRLEQKLADSLSGVIAVPDRASAVLEAIDQTLITQDHNWRDIIMALNSVPKPFNEYKKVALIKYMQYLTSRQEIVQTLYATRLVQRFGVEENEAAGGPAGAEDPKLKETLIFDLAAFASPPEQPEAFTRIPKGETIEIALEPNQTVDLLLAKCRCRISLSGNLTFADDQGNDSVLPKGKCVVGRDYNSDIVIDSSARDVSRKHLIVETDGQRRVRLTDISSHGTSVPPQFLERTG